MQAKSLEESQFQLCEIPFVYARVEIENHGLMFDEFVSDVGLRESYGSDEVARWLGYR